MAQAPRVETVTDWLKRGGGRSLASSEMLILSHRWKNRATDDFADFVPIRLVTIVEASVQNAVKDLVDNGGDYFLRSKTLFGAIKINFDYLSAIQGKQISIGDLVAHSVSVNRLENVLTVFSTLVDDFVNKLKTIHDRVAVELHGEPIKPIIDNYDEVARNMSRLFEVRHILVHEIPRKKPYEVKDIDIFIASCEPFCKALDAVISKETHGDYPLTQVEMNIAAAGKLEVAERELAAVLDQVRNREFMDLEELVASQTSWREFAQKEASFQASECKGGSIHGMIYAGALETLVKDRIAQLRRWIPSETEDDELIL
jgi:uncharacterized protein YecT (DUF1311 family)